MENLRIIATLIIVAVIALLSVFQMQIRGYSKVGRMEEWVLYVNETEDIDCPNDTELIYSDEINKYYISCIYSDSYIVKSGFEERLLLHSLEEELITIEELDELIEIIIIEK